MFEFHIFGREHNVENVCPVAADHMVKFFESEKNINRLEYQE